MSLEIPIPKEITKYEAKLIGPLTTRQTLFSVIGGGVAIAVNYFGNLIAPGQGLPLCIISAFPFGILGFMKIYGMPFEKYAIGYIKTHVLAPRTRKSRIKNQFALIDMEMNSNPESKKAKYKKSKQAFR